MRAVKSNAKPGRTVKVDSVATCLHAGGNAKDLLPIALGSHLDTQPTGGKFDGVLGVLGALEALRTLVDMGYESNAPLMIVNWTNEEGSRFAPAMLCSGVYAGVFTPEFAYSREDRDGISSVEELKRIGYWGRSCRLPQIPGDVRASHRAGGDDP